MDLKPVNFYSLFLLLNKNLYFLNLLLIYCKLGGVSFNFTHKQMFGSVTFYPEDPDPLNTNPSKNAVEF